MVQIDDLRITPEGDCLIIDCFVNEADYYKDIYLESITIDTQDSYLSSGASSNYVYKKEFKESDNTKRFEASIPKEEINCSLNDNIFFIYITVRGTPAPNTPCGYDNKTTIASVANLYPIFHKSICLLKVLNEECEFPKELIQHILQVKALELSILAGQYPLAIKHWKILRRNNTITSNCGCK